MRKLSLLAAAASTALLLSAAPAQAHEVIYTVNLSGAAEAPPNASPAIGTATVTYDLDLVTMRVQASFSGLMGNATAAHIHCCTTSPNTGTSPPASQVPSFAGFPTAVTSGSYDQTFDLTLASSYNPVFVTNQGSISNALNALLAGSANGTAYLNIHSSAFPGGEIRGFLVPAVPEPSTYALMLGGLVGLGALARRRRSAN